MPVNIEKACDTTPNPPPTARRPPARKSDDDDRRLRHSQSGSLNLPPPETPCKRAAPTACPVCNRSRQAGGAGSVPQLSLRADRFPAHHRERTVYRPVPVSLSALAIAGYTLLTAATSPAARAYALGQLAKAAASAMLLDLVIAASGWWTPLAVQIKE